MKFLVHPNHTGGKPSIKSVFKNIFQVPFEIACEED